MKFLVGLLPKAARGHPSQDVELGSVGASARVRINTATHMGCGNQRQRAHTGQLRLVHTPAETRCCNAHAAHEQCSSTVSSCKSKYSTGSVDVCMKLFCLLHQVRHAVTGPSTPMGTFERLSSIGMVHGAVGCSIVIHSCSMYIT